MPTNRIQVEELRDANLPDNTTGFITPLKHRAVVTIVLDYIDTVIATVTALITSTVNAAIDSLTEEYQDADDIVLAAANAYADSLVVGLLDDRGNHDASANLFPSTGGSGTAGAIKKGDLWTVSVSGLLGGIAVTAGDTVRAITDAPGQTAGNWVVTENNFGYVPEPTTNKTATAVYSTTQFPNWTGIINLLMTGKKFRRYFYDFTSQVLLGGSDLGYTISGTSARVQPIANNEVNRIGVADLQTGTTAAGRVCIGWATNSMFLNDGFQWTLEADIKIPTLSDVTNTFQIFFGLSDTATAGLPTTNGVGFNYRHTIFGGNFGAYVIRAGAAVSSDTGLAVVADQWYKLKIVCDLNGGEVKFYIDDVLEHTESVDLNIPADSGKLMGPSFGIYKSVGLTSRSLHIDYLDIIAQTEV